MHDNGMMPNIDIETLAETENYTIWRADEPDGEATYHVEIGPVTAHFFTEEWNDFVQLIRDSAAEFAQLGDPGEDDEDEDVEIELDWGSMLFSPDEWEEFVQLIKLV
jgi:hypothetical protein